MTAKACSTEEIDLINILNLGSEQHPVRMRRQATECEKIFSNNISDNATVSRKKELSKLNSKKDD